jgi:hypothetical protein
MISSPRWWVLSAVAPLAVLASGAAQATEASPSDEADDVAALSRIVQRPSYDLCPGPAPAGELRCLAKVISSDGIEPYPSNGGGSNGFAPADLLSAYAIPASSASGGKIVALIDATDSSGAFSDLTTYRTKYGLPTLPECTAAPTNGGPACFYKVNQTGEASNYPQPDPQNGWQGEIALDIEMVSALCPDCSILLVEATSATTANLGAAVNTAARMGAVAISNSYGGAEDNSVTSANTEYYEHAGILITAAAGDDAYSAGASFPASSPNVLGVGGTSLARSSSTRGWAETAWSSGGSGCSESFAAPSFQAALGLNDCSKRAVADVSAVGDPNTGLATYSAAEGGWTIVGGTSAASPIVAAIFTRLGLSSQTNAFPYAHTSAFYDVTSGSNGSCGGTEICTARVGYDGPTGIGTPNGTVLAASGTTTPPPTPTPDAGTSSGGADSGSTPPPAADAGAAPDSSVASSPDSGSVASGYDSGLNVGEDSGSAYGGGGSEAPDSGSTENGGNGGTDSPGGWGTASSGESGGCAIGSGAPTRGAGAFAVVAAVMALGARRRRSRSNETRSRSRGASDCDRSSRGDSDCERGPSTPL